MTWTCSRCQETHEEPFDSCWKCGTGRDGVVSETSPFEPEMQMTGQGSAPLLPCTTTPQYPGREIEAVLGIVCGETILGTGFLSEMFAGLSDLVGARSGVLEAKMRDSRQLAMAEMMEDAAALGANAVVGVKIGYEVIGNSMMMVLISGTAVRLEQA